MAAATVLSLVCYNHPEKKADFKCFDCKLGKLKVIFFFDSFLANISLNPVICST